MKIIRFMVGDSRDPDFGVLIRGRAVGFAVLQRKTGRVHSCLRDSETYLSNLPASEDAARELLAWGEAHLDDLSEGESFPLGAVRLLEPIEVAALFDFGLTPRHLKNSLETMMKYEKDDPVAAPLLQAFAKVVLSKRSRTAPSSEPEPLPFYKSNMNSVVGDGAVVPWPSYTSRLDIEPELAAIYGNTQQPVAGFCIFNDVSARDVQAMEIIGGFCRTKDMAKGNQLGPYLVTNDEAHDPYDQEVVVKVDGTVRYSGSTSEISHRAEDAFAWLETMGPIRAGSVVGLGTIPDCTGLDHDDFIDPNNEIEITFEHLGTLHCRFEEPRRKL